MVLGVFETALLLPHLDELLQRGPSVLSHMHQPPGGKILEGLKCLPSAKVLYIVAVHRPLLADDLGKLGVADTPGDARHRASGFDGLELPWIAHEHKFRPSPLAVRNELGHLLGAYHP